MADCSATSPSAPAIPTADGSLDRQIHAQRCSWPLSGRLAARRDGATWAEEFARLPALEQVTKDGGSGLANGLEQVNARRQQRGQPAAAEQDDHFHVLRDGRKALRA